MMNNYWMIPTTELNDLCKKYSDILDSCMPSDDAWDEAYAEYCKINAILDDRYREENKEAFNKFYEEHIKGKSWDEVDPDDLQCYSDWHKDMYGFRPRYI